MYAKKTGHPPLPPTGESRGKAWPLGPAAGLRLTKLMSTKERMWAVAVFLETWLWDSNMDSKTINSVDFTASKKNCTAEIFSGP